MKYKKEIKIEYRKTGVLTPQMKKILREKWIINWFWPSNISWIAKFLINKLKKIAIKSGRTRFESDADYHDYNYYLGGSENDRKKADRGFFQRLIKDTLELDLWWFSELYYVGVCIIAYRLVRRFGKKHFNYKK